MAVKDQQPDGSSNRWWLWYGALAVALHLVVLPSFEEFMLWKASKGPRKHVDLVSLAQVSPSMLAKARPPGMKRPAPVAQRVVPPIKKPEQKKKDDNVKGQVVDLPPSPDSRAPDKADYLSEHNTRTERETRSRHASADYDNVMNEPSVARKNDAGSKEPPPPPTALQMGPSDPKKDTRKKDQQEQASGAFEVPTVKQRDRLALRLDPKLGEFRNSEERHAVRGNSDRLKLSPGANPEAPSSPGTAPKQGLTMADLVPQVGVLARLSGGPSNDSLDNVEEGEGTFLNSREFKFASFFNRLKRGVSQHWRPLGEYQRRDPTGNIYGFQSRVTILTVTLNGDGSLQNVEVKHSSGVDFLDREAIAAFHRAEPFPNPPHGLIDNAGRIVFPFGFHLDFGRHSSLESPY